MSIIIGKNNVYNLFNITTKRPLFENGLTKNEMKNYIRERYGIRRLKDLPVMFSRVQKQGTSRSYEQSLEKEVFLFLQKENITIEQFILKYLTIKG